MVHKFLVVGERVSLVASRRDTVRSHLPLIELALPLEVYWKFGEAQKEFDRRVASGEDDMVLLELKREILRLLAPYAISEKDRQLIIGHIEIQMNLSGFMK